MVLLFIFNSLKVPDRYWAIFCSRKVFLVFYSILEGDGSVNVAHGARSGVSIVSSLSTRGSSPLPPDKPISLTVRRVRIFGAKSIAESIS